VDEFALQLLDAMAALLALKQEERHRHARQGEHPGGGGEHVGDAGIRLGLALLLGEQAELLCPGLPWRNIRGIGNWLRHQYDSVDVDAIWRTVVDDLPPLQRAVASALSNPSAKPPA
jgi:hypothetical protein